MDLSIVIVSYNTSAVLKDCIQSIYENTEHVDYEIIIVDNNSQDDSVSMLKKNFSSVKIIENKDNAGFAKANNQGIEISKGNYILLLNSDTLVRPDCLNKLLQFSENNEKAGVVGCRVLNGDMSFQDSCWHDPNIFSELAFFTKTIIKNFWDPFTHFKFMKYWNHQDVRKVPCLGGCFLWIKKEVIDEVSGLDEDFFMYYEDFEFCHRVRTQTQYGIFYYPLSEIIHLGGKSADRYKHSMVRSCFKSAQIYFEKCYGAWQSWIFTILCKIIWLIELVILSLLCWTSFGRRKWSLIWELICL